MEIYLIRHTKPDIKKGICYGQSDIGVAASYKDEVAVIKDKLKGVIPDVVYSSPLIRCHQLAKEFSKDVILDDRLKELNFGDWELKAWDDIPRSESEAWMNDFVNVSTKNGESYIDLQQRVLSFYNEFLQEKNETILVFTHAGVIRALLAWLKKMPLKDSFSIPVSYGDVKCVV